jgi:hypothetical protein
MRPSGRVSASQKSSKLLSETITSAKFSFSKGETSQSVATTLEAPKPRRFFEIETTEVSRKNWRRRNFSQDRAIAFFASKCFLAPSSPAAASASESKILWKRRRSPSSPRPPEQRGRKKKVGLSTARDDSLYKQRRCETPLKPAFDNSLLNSVEQPAEQRVKFGIWSSSVGESGSDVAAWGNSSSGAASGKSPAAK